MLKNKTILVTGGTGSFGQELIKTLIKKHRNIKKIIVFSRDELKQYEMSLQYPYKNFKKLRFFLGDIRDYQRLCLALEGVDYVIHAAALKQVDKAEYNPFEYIQTNVIGANNLINACLYRNVKKVVALSTDKACAPINLYGATKLCSDKLFIAANNIVGKRKISFCVVRYGNVMMSRGSVIPKFLQSLKKSNVLNITDPNMTRFNLTLKQSVDIVLMSLKNSMGGEIFVPKLFSYKITDLAHACAKFKKISNLKINVSGIRDGEKLHEELLSASESMLTLESKDFYIICGLGKIFFQTYQKKFKLKKLNKSFSYNSLDNKLFLTQNNLVKLIREISG